LNLGQAEYEAEVPNIVLPHLVVTLVITFLSDVVVRLLNKFVCSNKIAASWLQQCKKKILSCKIVLDVHCIGVSV
jgi:hypothetical protein